MFKYFNLKNIYSQLSLNHGVCLCTIQLTLNIINTISKVVKKTFLFDNQIINIVLVHIITFHSFCRCLGTSQTTMGGNSSVCDRN